jgi:hypothetical protein
VTSHKPALAKAPRQASAGFRIWACAAVDEIISALHRGILLGRVERSRGRGGPVEAYFSRQL